MAKKIKKKKKTNKKEVELSFATLKSEFANNIIALQKKQKLFETSSIEDIEEELKKHDISLTKEEVIQKYEETYNIDDFIGEYNCTFEKQLQSLEKSQYLFDEDCLFLYINKIIHEYKIINDIPDPDFIVQTLKKFPKLAKEDKPAVFLKQLKLLNRIKDYTKERDINVIFKRTNFDIEWCLSDMLGIEVMNCFPDMSLSQEIADEVFTFIDTYTLQLPVYLYTDALGLIARHGYEGVKEYFEEGLKKYPKHSILLYNGVMSELHTYSDQQCDYTDIINLYNEVIHLTPTSQEEKENLEIIKENFSKVLSKIN